MNKEKQRIAIAKACGWKKVKGGVWPELCWLGPNKPRKGLMPWQGLGEYTREPPDFLNDLNAMAIAEEWLREQPDNEFSKTCISSYDLYLIRNFGPRAKAHERAETFLKILNLWKDGI